MDEPKEPLKMEQVIAQTSTVCSPPLIYQRLNELINHPHCSVKDISRTISEDQGLVARILKLVNSPMFGCFSKVDSIDRATTIIGTQQLRDLTLAATVMQNFKGIPETLLCMTDFWRHGICCGIVSRNLAILLREQNVEQFFVTGMLHEIGQLVIATSMPNQMNRLLSSNREQGETYTTTERRFLGFDHAELGGSLLDSWRIPQNIAEPVCYHHTPLDSKLFPLEACVIHLADTICQAMQFGSNGERGLQSFKPSAWDHLGLPLSSLEIILKQSIPQTEETFSILEDSA